ncbi:hypothetical protein RJ640_000890 [Escallonia rubra]|uniref:Retrovirus-related Pol polyprotein from transposon RE1 n=1 Tax=Escallonia rubra TaxID=112253 RepID=A0AA88QRQ5_9ASTE|nr:hypothetical protein RJ640_000890 [Escallonia rubra]
MGSHGSLSKSMDTGMLSEEALGVVVGLKTSTNVWKALGDTFSQNSQATEFELLAQLQVKKGNASLSDHLRDFKKTCDQLNAVGKPVTYQNKVFWLLSGLGPKYESFATTMLKPHVPSYADLIPLLQSHELRSKGHQSESLNHSMVYYSQRTSNGNKNSDKKGGSSYFTSKGKATDIPKALAAMHVIDSQDSKWFLVTGAIAHITEDPGKLSNLVRYQGSDSVMSGFLHKLHNQLIFQRKKTIFQERARLFTGDPPALDQTRDQVPILFPPTELEIIPLVSWPPYGEPLVVPNSTSPFTIPSTTCVTPPSNSQFDVSPSSTSSCALSHPMITRSKQVLSKPIPSIQVNRTPDGLFLHQSKYADWAGCPSSRQSTTGFCTFLGSNCISWSAKKQSIVARSSAEAEYREMASTTAKLTWLSFLLRDVGMVQHHPATLFCDNLATLYMSINPVFHARTKHIEVDYHFVREKVALGSLVTRFVSSNQQLADIFTKPLSRDAFQHLRTKLGLCSYMQLSLRGSNEDLN